MAPGLHYKQAYALSLFPRELNFTKEETKVMRVLQKILFLLAMIAGMSAVSYAQKDKKPPPKETSPVVNPKPKNPPPKDKPKKPGEAMAFWKSETSETV